MIALDTNVLIRFFVRDDEEQARRALKLIETCREEDDSCLICNPVLCEVEWVLESVYRASRADIVAAVRMLQTTPPFVLEDAELVDRALQMYASGKGDLSDYLLGEIASARGARTTYTFDRDLRSAKGFTLLLTSLGSISFRSLSRSVSSGLPRSPKGLFPIRPSGTFPQFAFRSSGYL